MVSHGVTGSNRSSWKFFRDNLLVRAELLSSPAVYRLGDGIGVRHHAGAQQQGLKSPDYQEQAARITGSLDSSCVETD
jgi:hypothetical protein